MKPSVGLGRQAGGLTLLHALVAPNGRRPGPGLAVEGVGRRSRRRAKSNQRAWCRAPRFRMEVAGRDVREKGLLHGVRVSATHREILIVIGAASAEER